MNLNYSKDKSKDSLLELLQKYKNMIDGTSGKYTGSDYAMKLKEDTKPFPISKIHELILKIEVNWLIKIGGSYFYYT